MSGNLFRKYCLFEDFWCILKNKGSEQSRRKEVFDIVESRMGSSYWYKSYTLQNTSLQKNKFIKEGCSVWAETSLRTHFVWGARMFRSTLVNTMQLATWDFPQAGGVLPQCSRRQWGGRTECKKKTRRGRKGVTERPCAPRKRSYGETPRTQESHTRCWA